MPTQRRLSYFVTDEVLIALGRVVVEFQALEFQIKAGILVMLGGPMRQSQIVATELSFKNACHLVSSLVKECIEDGAVPGR